MKLFLYFLGIFASTVIMFSTSFAGWDGPKPIDHIEPSGNAIFRDTVIYRIPIEVCENYKNAHECNATCRKPHKKISRGCLQQCEDKHPWRGDLNWDTQVRTSCSSSTKK